MKQVQLWWKQAQNDLKAARNSLSTRDFSWSSFQAQQAAEKALKTFLIKKELKIPKVHDLIFLGRKAGLDENLLNKCDQLTWVYIETRYPNLSGEPSEKKFTKQLAEKHLKIAEEILQWVAGKI